VSPDDPLLGRTLPGGYVILELVGIGGMGRVYRAEQTNLGRTVAVKIIHPHLVGEENAAARFITEARAASRLNHPNSVGVIDFGKTSDGQLYLVMEFLRGSDLARVAYDEGPLPFRRVVDVLRQVLAALFEAHALEIIHRDLKPENIILEPTRSGGDFVKVVDFGLAKMRVEVATPSITSPGIVCGTPEYMSPEQGRGDPLDGQSDLYSVGVILYQLLTGRLPFEGDSPTQVVLMHLTQPPKDPRALAPDRRIPDPIVAVCLRSLSKEPRDRFRGADKFSEALADALAEVEGERASARQIEATSFKCSSCGALNAVAQKFCGECGAPLAYRAGSKPVSPGASIAPPSLDDERTLPGIAGRDAPSPRGRLKLPLPMLGRQDDLAWLDERRADARSTLCGARVVGDAGIGKTRLLREFLTSCADTGDVVVEAGPDPAWAEVGYYALRRTIRALTALPENGGTSRDWTAATAEARRGLADIFAHRAVDKPGESSGTGGRAAALSPDDRRFAAAEALRWAVVRASERARGRRVVIAVDDLHHVDGASRNAFADSVGEPPLVPSLLVVTYAPGFDPGFPANAAARVLTGVPVHLVTKLFSESGTKGLPSLSGARAMSPLYLDQLLRFTREQGQGAPTRLADIIALRVERLPADARRLLQAVAVLGDDATGESTLPLLPNEIDLVEALSLLSKAGMVDETDGRLKTTHPLVREVVLATIPAAVRRELHGAAAGVCENAGAPPEVLALHAYYAHNAFQALILLERVSGLAAARGDLFGSILALRRGLELARRELVRGELDDPMRAVLIFSRKLGEALAKAGHFTDSEGVLREALDMAGPSGEDRARVLGALAHIAHGRDRVAEARVYLREAIELANRTGSSELVSSLADLGRAIAV
jgi:serine/threonine protein kinase